MSIKSIILVHGAFADGSCWAKVIPFLSSKGFTVVAVQNPLSSLADDVKATNRAIDMQDGAVILAGHCWGGAVITEAGNHPRVAGLVYIAAGAPDSGSCYDTWWKDFLPEGGVPGIEPYGEGYVALTREGARDTFAQDLPADEIDIFFAVQGPLAGRCFTDRISHAAWKIKPTYYIVAEDDRTVPPAVQWQSAERMKAKVTFLSSSHVPILSQPKKVASVIEHAANAL